MRGCWLVAWLAAGCSGDGGGKEPIVPKGDDDDIVGDDDDTTPLDTAPEGQFLDATGFLVTARFAFDPDNGLHVPYAEPGAGLSPVSLTVTIIDSAALYGGEPLDDRTSCNVTLEADGSVPVAPWVATTGAWTGFDLPAGATVRDTCRFYGLPSGFGGDAGGHVAKWTWGIGVAALPEAVATQIRQSVPPSEWAALEAYLVGAVLRTDVLTGMGATTDGQTDAGYTLGYEVDGNFEIEAGGTGGYRPILGDDISAGLAGVARGYYEVQLGVFGPGELLTRDPSGY
ncbi:MAG: hypothetical protein R3F59_38255 [Myxococcota bacterium]